VQAYELFSGGVSSFDYLGCYEGLGQVGTEWAEAFGVPPWAERRLIASLAG
jgi:hypothetical protein